MRCILKTRAFSRWADGAGITDADLRAAVHDMEAGRTGTSLGGGVYKLRVVLPGRGRSGGARTIIATNLGDRWVFLFGFKKNEMENITRKKLVFLKSYAKQLLGWDEHALGVFIADGELERVSRNG